MTQTVFTACPSLPGPEICTNGTRDGDLVGTAKPSPISARAAEAGERQALVVSLV